MHDGQVDVLFRNKLNAPNRSRLDVLLHCFLRSKYLLEEEHTASRYWTRHHVME
jgi:hypothetical protein